MKPPRGEYGITFRNEMSGLFRLTRALMVLDGQVLVDVQGTPEAPVPSENAVVQGSVPTGEHVLQVLLRLQGWGEGPFWYLSGYRFELKSSHRFRVLDGRPLRLEAVGYERGHGCTPIEQRPAIRYVDIW